MKVKLSMPLDGHKPGDVVDRPDGRHLIQCGWATEAPAKKAKPKRPKDTDPVVLVEGKIAPDLMEGLVEPGQD